MEIKQLIGSLLSNSFSIEKIVEVNNTNPNIVKYKLIFDDKNYFVIILDIDLKKIFIDLKQSYIEGSFLTLLEFILNKEIIKLIIKEKIL
jgi:hypothetical protein